MILFYSEYSLSSAISFTKFQFHYDLILLKAMNDFAAFIYGFQFHYDLILLLHGFMLPLMKLYFNFIMILFYLKSIKKYGWKAMLFQFHYDLILFLF